MQAQQIDLEDKAPTQEYIILNGKDEALEAEIKEVQAVINKAVATTMRYGKLVRVKKGKPCEWKSLSAREHLCHAVVHGHLALGGADIMNVDDETGLPNLFHNITRDGFAIWRYQSDEEKADARRGDLTVINPED